MSANDEFKDIMHEIKTIVQGKILSMVAIGRRLLKSAEN